MADKLNLTGAWFGHYVQPGLRRTIQFIGSLTEQGGNLTGTISEPNPKQNPGSAYLNAIVAGVRSGTRVAFVKAYDGASDYAHAVDYEGVLSKDGDCVSGRWRIARTMGVFTMSRTQPGEEEIVAVTVPVAVCG